MRRFFARFYHDINKEYFCIKIGYIEGLKKYIRIGDAWKHYPEMAPSEPTLAFPDELFQAEKPMMQALLDGILEYAAEQGVRPSKPLQNPSELKATQYHLSDMRRLVFKKGGTG